MMQIRDLVTASTGISLIPYSCPCKTQLSFWACKPQLFVWNLQHLPYSCGCLEDRERERQSREVNPKSWWLKVSRWHTGTGKTEPGKTDNENRGDEHQSKRSRYRDAARATGNKTTKNRDGTKQTQPLLPVCSNDLAKRQRLKEQTSLLDRRVVKRVENWTKSYLNQQRKWWQLHQENNTRSVSGNAQLLLVTDEKPLAKTLKFVSWQWLCGLVKVAAQVADHHHFWNSKGLQSRALWFYGLFQGLTGPSPLPWAAGSAFLSSGSLSQNKLFTFCLLTSVSL